MISLGLLSTACNLYVGHGSTGPDAELTASSETGSALAAPDASRNPAVNAVLVASRDPATRPGVVGAYVSMGYWNTGEVERTMSELGMHGVNLVIDYALTPPENETWAQAFDVYMDAASRHGIGVAFPLGPALKGMTPGNPDGYIDAAVALVRQLKNEPRITAWYVHDEILPGVAGSDGTRRYALSLEQMKELYRAIRGADPSRPQLVVWNSLPTYDQFQLIYTGEKTPYGRAAWMDHPAAYEQALSEMIQQTCDWVLVDSYPVGAPWRDASSPAPEVDVLTIVRRAAALKQASQPLIFVFQGFSWAQYSQDAVDTTFPTRKQIEAMLCAAHVAGATGAVGYSWFDLTDQAPEKKIRGQLQALSTFKHVLSGLSHRGWPVVELAQAQ